VCITDREQRFESLSLLLAKSQELDQDGWRLYQYDDPVRKVLGFEASKPNSGVVRHVIGLSDVKKSLAEIEPEQLRVVVRSRIRSVEGRRRLFGCHEGHRPGTGGPDTVRLPVASKGLTVGVLADAFALVEENDLGVARVVGHADHWDGDPELQAVLDRGPYGSGMALWGADIDMDAAPGKIELYAEDESEPRVTLTIGRRPKLKVVGPKG